MNKISTKRSSKTEQNDNLGRVKIVILKKCANETGMYSFCIFSSVAESFQTFKEWIPLKLLKIVQHTEKDE